MTGATSANVPEEQPSINVPEEQPSSGPESSPVPADIGMEMLVARKKVEAYAQLITLKGERARRFYDTIDQTRDSTIAERRATRRNAFTICMSVIVISSASLVMGFVLFLADRTAPATALSSAGLVGVLGSALTGLARLSTSYRDLIPELEPPTD
jgi:hypothetical protein